MQRAATPFVTSNDHDELDSLVESVRSAAIAGLLRSIRLDRQRKCNDFVAYMTRVRSRIIREVNQQFRRLNSIKVQVKIVAEYEKPPVIEQSGGALQRARRAARRRRYEEEENDKNVATIGLTTKLTPITDRVNVRSTIELLVAELRERHINAIQLGS